jgi:hypothetical protein
MWTRLQLNSTQLVKIVKCSEFRKTGQIQLSWVSWVVSTFTSQNFTQLASWVELSWVESSLAIWKRLYREIFKYIITASMVSDVHYVGVVQPLTTSLTCLIIGGTLPLASPPTYILGVMRPSVPWGLTPLASRPIATPIHRLTLIRKSMQMPARNNKVNLMLPKSIIRKRKFSLCSLFISVTFFLHLKQKI